MNLEQLIRNRRTIHDYKRSAVSWELISQALELSLWSLNHKLTFPWVYIRVGPEARQQIAEVMVEKKEAKKGPLSEAMKNSIRNKILSPAEVIFLGQKKTSDPDQAKEDYATIACGIQIASLFLWDKGIGSKWSTGGFTQSEKTFSILGVDTRATEIVGCLFIGIADRIPKVPERPALSQVLTEIS